MGDTTVLEGQAEGRFPAEVQPGPPFGLPVRDPVEHLRQQQSGQQRRRVRRPALPRGVQGVEILVGEQFLAGGGQSCQEPVVVQELAADQLNLAE